MDCIRKNSIVFLTGPAGSAKTHVATAWGVRQLVFNDVKLRISRPAIGQGVELGFLPGTAEQKLCPYLMPVFDSIEKLVGEEASKRVKSQLEIFPLSIVRGRTIEHSTLIVDEAQNLGYDEIKTICTRIGDGGKIIFCGDISQSDVRNSPLEEVAQRLDGAECEGLTIGWYEFTEDAIVRHPLIKEILRRMAS